MGSATETQAGAEAGDNPAEIHRALMARVAACRDREAFGALFLYFGPRVKSLMLKGGADHAQAEDIVQDVMMVVWRKVHLYAPDRGSVSAWIFTIARNARIDRLRRSASRPYQDIDDLELASEDSNGEDDAIANQRSRRVANAMEELPADQREIIDLAYIQDMSQSEIAAQLNVPLGTVKSRMRLAYAKLRDKLEEMQ
ncbi:sigma-70 family RNA polymerase sigma factor [Mariluticola halotolerans]|uniref:sigma-70 family RNA polymerase sigma factor n=1 Tax=Mariluticola halotolerans TaxID=2909283 RepID=UPI0026E24158|nr:sigma-70 family RNA polymerase sigma factor [Mariluticola halotolerans]UJQ94328.1 sigma-70 family RNA polymerase sigma factor [Mariluticola halotolerans]